ncbi:hypothetical protein ACFOLK_18335 [Marinococcus halophilus]|uniref:Uncharacterized protein n=1 Tax=Marinococcus halophilus TaxID=1371 RepID=A0A510Y975_MARHA|nr:hypothetical protein [Marinococcus halophilus]GEK59905.1 hypothetical protein MHA01_28100 [Marinococcus halophilus]
MIAMPITFSSIMYKAMFQQRPSSQGKMMARSMKVPSVTYFSPKGFCIWHVALGHTYV